MGGRSVDMDLQELRTLYNNGTLQKLFKAGFVTVKPLLIVEFYNYMEAKKLNKTDAVRETSIIFHLGESTIWKYLKEFNYN